MDWQIILATVVGAPTIISGITMLMLNRYFSRKDKKENTRDANIEKLDTLKDDYDKFVEKANIDHSEIERHIGDINLALEEQSKSVAALNNAIQALLRDRIIQVYNYYYNVKRYMPIYERESLDHMYEEYKLMGGNGMIEDLIRKLRELPTENDSE